MNKRYIPLGNNLYFDSKEKIIVKNLGNRYVFVRHDRRRKDIPVTDEKRKFNKVLKDLISLGNNLYFDKKLKQIYKKVGGDLILYSKDRRKEQKSVNIERRKK